MSIICCLQQGLWHMWFSASGGSTEERHQNHNNHNHASFIVHFIVDSLRIKLKLTPSPSFMKSFRQMCAMMPVAKASPITLTMVRNLSLWRKTGGVSLILAKWSPDCKWRWVSAPLWLVWVFFPNHGSENTCYSQCPIHRNDEGDVISRQPHGG